MTDEIEETWEGSYSDSYSESYAENSYSQSKYQAAQQPFQWTKEHQASLERLKAKTLKNQKQNDDIQKALASLKDEEISPPPVTHEEYNQFAELVDRLADDPTNVVFSEALPKVTKEKLSVTAINNELKAEMGLND